uniref:Uncharacterized protein n=1 Tax=Vespula pensylvanica TaxID=30213 RepID=A0A834KHF0_VESPE|nr:hypothetical protein H0235_014780 [Vespula pensylvanica]
MVLKSVGRSRKQVRAGSFAPVYVVFYSGDKLPIRSKIKRGRNYLGKFPIALTFLFRYELIVGKAVLFISERRIYLFAFYYPPVRREENT